MSLMMAWGTEAIRLIAEPPVQHWTFMARFAAHTAIWTLWLTFLQYLVLLVIQGLRHLPHIRQSARSPQLSTLRMLYETTLGYVGWAWPLGMFAAWLNPGAPGGWVWDYSCPNLVAVLYFCLATLCAYDAASFFLHRWLHVNKTAFVWLHAKHHEHQAALDVRTAGYMTPLEGIFSDALPMLAIYALGAATGNWWYSFAGVWNAFHIVMVGHCGHDVSLTNLLNVPVLLINPMGFAFLCVSVRATPKEHEDHHAFPRRNFSYFFTFWDDLYGTSHKKNPPSSLLFLATHGLYQFVFFTSEMVLVKHTGAYITTWLLLYVLVTPGAAAAAADWLGLPEATRRALGWFMDAYRRDAHITYQPAGTPGAFTPLEHITQSPVSPNLHRAAGAGGDGSDTATDTQPSRDQDQDGSGSSSGQKPPVYLFACHPTGLISRGAFLTFGARGWASPVAALPKVRLAVASLLLQVPLPFWREFLLACGCVPADWTSLKRALLRGTSLAITPGGWAESKYLESYKLVLKRRRGFVALAAETGAALVPVLCLGEQDVVGPAEPGYWFVKQIIPMRCHPVHVVFGKPLVPGKEETVSQLHARYTEALQALAKQHNVQLDVVE